ncbi:hypothetical protein [Shumkonia mesophila]|uniref:hypothetical protein n=1 Tax=Shumkonia mesophila TaxID=2838854 RepID=UPI002934B6BE|nr:hypothetical protein [Shumkonia mesophila]
MAEVLIFGLLALVVVAGGAVVLLRRRPSRPAPRIAPPKLPPAPPGATERPSVAAGPPGDGRIRGRVRASSKRTVGDIVEHHPDEAASVLRRWLKSDDR